MLVRTVRHHGHFRWKKLDVFLTEVLGGESIGLLPENDRWFTIYFAHLPLARFDSEKLQVLPCKATQGFYNVRAATQLECASPPRHGPPLAARAHQTQPAVRRRSAQPHPTLVLD